MKKRLNLKTRRRLYRSPWQFWDEAAFGFRESAFSLGYNGITGGVFSSGAGGAVFSNRPASDLLPVTVASFREALDRAVASLGALSPVVVALYLPAEELAELKAAAVSVGGVYLDSEPGGYASSLYGIELHGLDVLRRPVLGSDGQVRAVPLDEGTRWCRLSDGLFYPLIAGTYQPDRHMGRPPFVFQSGGGLPRF